MKGATSANGAIVMSRASATRPRAWVTEVLKNRVPASATATKPSPMLPPAESSMRCARPVRPAPDAPVILCKVRLAPLAAPAPALAADCDTETKDLVARRARAPTPDSSMDQVLGLPERNAAPPARKVTQFGIERAAQVAFRLRCELSWCR